MLQLQNLTLAHGARVLFEEASLQIPPGHRVGIIGANGCGKSSLFQLILQQLAAERGELLLPRQWQIAHVRQETPALQRSAIDYVLDGHQQLRSLQQQLAQAEQRNDGEQMAHLHAALDAIDHYRLQSEAATLLAGLGFDENAQQQMVASFSGGWRMRLNLAQALLQPSDLLLLDEPTNHLDLDAVIWLESWLRRYSGTLLLISHDRDFLDATIQSILHIDQQRCQLYTGNYSSFERQKAERLLQQQAQHQKTEQRRAELERFIARFKAKASKAKQAQSRVKMLAKLEQTLPAHAASPFSFEFRPAEQMPHPLIQFEQLNAGYDPARPVLNQIKLNLVPGSRIGLLGQNGAGKSTLVKLLAGKLQPLEGQVEQSSGVRIGYFEQHQVDTLDQSATPITLLQRLSPDATEQELRNYLGSFAFSGDRAFEPIAPFSGGEKARLTLALIVWQRPNLLLMDEPTNHLDLEMRHALTLALQSFEGAMILVSHDRHLLNATCEDFYLVHDGQVEPYVGDLDSYRQWLLQQNTPTETRPSSGGKAEQRKEQKRKEAELRNKLRPLRNALEQAEQKLASLDQQLAAIEQQLADSTLYQSDQANKLQTLLQQQGQLNKQREEIESTWFEYSEQLEQAEQDATNPT